MSICSCVCVCNFTFEITHMHYMYNLCKPDKKGFANRLSLMNLVFGIKVCRKDIYLHISVFGLLKRMYLSNNNDKNDR